MYTDEYGVQFSDDKKTLLRAPQNLTGDYVVPSEVTKFMATHFDVWGFYGCKKLTSVSIPNSVQSLGHYAFSNCPKLQKVVLPKGLERIGQGLFKDCGNLTDIQIPEGVISIDDHAFDGCTSLRSIHIPSGVQYIHEYAFRNCVNLREIDIPKSVTSIGQSAFSGCSHLALINLPEGISIASNAFKGCPGREGDGSVPFIDEFGVRYSANRKVLLRIPKDFKGEYVIPNDTEELHYGALEGCEFITALTLPDSMCHLQASFEDCIRLEYIYVSEKHSTYKSIDGVLFNKNLTTLVQYPAAKQQSTYLVPEGVTLIESFSHSQNLESVQFPESLKLIDPYAFDGCKCLSSVNLPEGLEEIPCGAFAYCPNLQSVNLPNSIKVIRYSAFEGCEHLKTLNIPGDEIEIEAGTFNGCKDFFDTDTYKELLSLGYEGDFDLDAECLDEPFLVEPESMDYTDEVGGRHVSWYEGDHLIEIELFLKSTSLMMLHKNRSVDGGFAKEYEIKDVALLKDSLEVGTNKEIISALVDECKTPYAGFDLRRFFDFLRIYHIQNTETNLGTYDVTFNADFEPEETFIPAGDE